MRVLITPERCIREYRDLIETLVARRMELGMTQIDLAERAGLQEGYAGKIEAWKHKKSGRRLGRVSLPLVLEALGVSIVVVTDSGKALSRVRAGETTKSFAQLCPSGESKCAWG